MSGAKRLAKRSILGTRVSALWQQDGRYYPGVIRAQVSEETGGAKAQYTVRFDDGFEATVTGKDIIGQGFQTGPSGRLKHGQKVFITMNGREVSGVVAHHDRRIDEVIIGLKPPAGSGSGSEDLTITRKVDDVRLMESRKSARLVDHLSTDYSKLADVQLSGGGGGSSSSSSSASGGVNSGGGAGGGGVGGGGETVKKQRAVSHSIDVPVTSPAFKQRPRRHRDSSGDTEGGSEYGDFDDVDMMDETIAAMVLTSLSVSPKSPPFGGFQYSRVPPSATITNTSNISTPGTASASAGAASAGEVVLGSSGLESSQEHSYVSTSLASSGFYSGHSERDDDPSPPHHVDPSPPAHPHPPHHQYHPNPLHSHPYPLPQNLPQNPPPLPPPHHHQPSHQPKLSESAPAAFGLRHDHLLHHHHHHSPHNSPGGVGGGGGGGVGVGVGVAVVHPHHSHHLSPPSSVGGGHHDPDSHHHHHHHHALLSDGFGDGAKDDEGVRYRCTWRGCGTVCESCNDIERHIRRAHFDQDSDLELSDREEEFYYEELDDDDLDSVTQSFADMYTSSPPSTTTTTLLPESLDMTRTFDHDYQRKADKVRVPPSPPLPQQASSVPSGGSFGLSGATTSIPITIPEGQIKRSLSWQIQGSPGAMVSPPQRSSKPTPQERLQQHQAQSPKSHMLSLSPMKGPGPHRKPRSEVRKCRKVYGMEHRDQWCTQCKWKKACTRFLD